MGLPEGAEGSDAAGFLRVNLSKWIPSLRGRDIEIDRAHRVYDGGRGSDRPRTLIFRVPRWHDRSDILKGARQAYPVSKSRGFYQLPVSAEDVCRGSAGGATGYTAVSPARREGLDGRDGHGPSCPVGDDGRMDMDAC